MNIDIDKGKELIRDLSTGLFSENKYKSSIVIFIAQSKQQYLRSKALIISRTAVFFQKLIWHSFNKF